MAAPEHFPAPSPDDSVAGEAGAWIARRDRGLTAGEQDTFLQWLHADPRHRAALQRLDRAWSALDALAAWQPADAARPNPDLLARTAPRSHRTRWWGVGIGLAAALAVLLFRGPSAVPESPVVSPSVRVVARPEQQALADGSVAEVNHGGRLELAFGTAERRVRLREGEVFNRGRPALMASIVLAAFALVFLDDSNGSRIITQERTFFGVLRTRATPLPAQEGRPAAERRTLSHGTTLHGAQIVGDPTPLTYYNPRTSLGEAVLAGLARREHNSLALIGLGTGSTACLTSPADELTIYEIDPAVVRLSARPGGDFTFVPMCQPDARLELGDARLRLAHAPDGAYDVIVVDAFSSDAVPAHLLTREAVALYLAKINEQGIVVLHLSNRNLALVSEAARVARDLNAPTLYRVNPEDIRDAEGVVVGNVTSVMVLARSPVVLATLPLASPWQVLRAPSGPSWSDDYINIARAFWENLGGGEDCVLAPETEACRRRAAR